MVVPGLNKQFSDPTNLTAISVASRLAIKKVPKDPKVVNGIDFVMNDLLDWDPKGFKVDFYFGYHGTLAMSLAGGPNWAAWREKMKSALLARQNRDKGCRYGS